MASVEPTTLTTGTGTLSRGNVGDVGLGDCPSLESKREAPLKVRYTATKPSMEHRPRTRRRRLGSVHADFMAKATRTRMNGMI
jgi:hypothetical protein